MKIRVILTLMGLAFAVTLAIVVGLRLSTEAMAVIVGVVAGVAASIPSSLIVSWFALRNQRPAPEPPPAEPRIIYVAATPPLPAWPDATPLPSTTAHLPALATPDRAPWTPRRFTGLPAPDAASIPVDALTRRAQSVSVIGGLE